MSLAYDPETFPGWLRREPPGDAEIRERLKLGPTSFAPIARDCPHGGKCGTEELCKGYGECKLDHTSVEAPRGPDLKKLEAELARKPLDEIAELTRKLTYEEMMVYAEGLWAKLPESGNVKPADFPKMLHEWSKNA